MPRGLAGVGGGERPLGFAEHERDDRRRRGRCAAAPRLSGRRWPAPARPARGSALQHPQRRERAGHAAGASPVSKMNVRAGVDQVLDRPAPGPSTAPPWLPSALDSVTVTHDVRRAGESGRGDRPPPPAPTTPSACASSTTSAAPCPRRTAAQLGQRGQVAVDGEDRVGDDERPAASARRRSALATASTSAVRHHGDLARRTSRQASMSEAWLRSSETIEVAGPASAVTAPRLAR